MRPRFLSPLVLSLLSLVLPLGVAAGPVTPEDVLKIRLVTAAAISPRGDWIAYTVRVPRQPGDDPGTAYSELYLVSTKTGESRPYVTGEVGVSSPRWSPDGTRIAFLTERGEKAKTQVWIIPLDGGEARQATHSPTSVAFFRWHPDGRRIGYVAPSAKTEKEEKLEEKGYGFVFFEENLKHRNLHIVDLQEGEERQVTEGITVWDFEFAPSGDWAVASVSEKNLIDHRYVFRRLVRVDTGNGEIRPLADPKGKLGNYALSPDGRTLAYTAALNRSDNAVSQVYVVRVGGGEPRNLTPPDLRGHATWAAWKDDKRIVFRAEEGVYTSLYQVSTRGGRAERILDGRKIGFVFYSPSATRGFKLAALRASSPTIPRDLFLWQPGKEPKRLTELNPWLRERDLGKQEAVRYKARDGLEIEGVLVYPVGYREGERYPLIVTVHGGPESHYDNGWHTGYFQPSQVLAGKGYLVFMPNYRASTGYGVSFAMEGHNDAAGKEFDDIADGIDYLVETGLADGERVGLGGGSYGGFAAAWFSSYYTKYVRAVCMFVGISDLVSKRGTTDIPYEELFVHSGKKLEEMWDKSLKRSPIYWAHQSRTAVLILGGLADTRVHPSQSLEYYRRLKMNGHPAVRLLRYPGEGHGNRKQPGRIDVLYRTLDWYDWYVKDAKPLDGPLPPLDISSRYGLDLD